MNIYLDTLKQVLDENNKSRLFCCIKELATNGVSLERFTEGEHTPSSKDLIRFIARWFKRIRMSEGECRDWMNEYHVEILSSVYSGPGLWREEHIRSQIKSVYESDTVFDCGCENNPFKASCGRNCLVYKEMLDKWEERKARETNMSYTPRTGNKIWDMALAVPVRSVKEKYNDQFEEAVNIICDHVGRHVPRDRIVKVLNERGFKTKTGKKWTYSSLSNVLRRRNRDVQGEETDRDEDNKTTWGEETNELERNDRAERKDVALSAHPVKERYSAQFEEALSFLQGHIKKGTSKHDVVALLNKRGFKTRTGRKWTYVILGNELTKLKRNVDKDDE